MTILVLAGCERPAAAPPDQQSIPTQAARPAFDRTVANGAIAILCDPVRFRLSIRHRADQATLNQSYPRRIVIDPNDLVVRFPNHAGEEQYQRGLIRYERCGPLIVKLVGDFLNGNLGGAMGAIEPFAAVSVTMDNTGLYPDRREPIRLAECDVHISRWGDCARDYAVRLDFDYRPAADPADPASDRMLIREWARSGDVLGGGIMEESKRTTSVEARLGLWWANRR